MHAESCSVTSAGMPKAAYPWSTVSCPSVYPQAPSGSIQSQAASTLCAQEGAEYAEVLSRAADGSPSGAAQAMSG